VRIRNNYRERKREIEGRGGEKKDDIQNETYQ